MVVMTDVVGAEGKSIDGKTAGGRYIKLVTISTAPVTLRRRNRSHFDLRHLLVMPRQIEKISIYRYAIDVSCRIGRFSIEFFRHIVTPIIFVPRVRFYIPRQDSLPVTNTDI